MKTIITVLVFTCIAQTVFAADVKTSKETGRAPAGAVLDGDVKLKIDTLTSPNGSTQVVTQIIDKTRQVVCYSLGTDLACVKHGN